MRRLEARAGKPARTAELAGARAQAELPAAVALPGPGEAALRER
jgi:hypothetical protein